MTQEPLDEIIEINPPTDIKPVEEENEIAEIKSRKEDIIAQTAEIAQKITTNKDIKTNNYERKGKLMKAMGNNFFGKGYEELVRTMGGSQKPNQKNIIWKKHLPNQISMELDKYESKLSKKREYHGYVPLSNT